MATTSERTDDNVNKKEGEGEEETKNIQLSSTDGEQGAKTTDTSSSTVQSTNEDKKSDETSPTSDTNKEKTNEEQTIETTTQQQEQSTTDIKTEETTTVVSSDLNNDQDSKKDQLTTSLNTSNEEKKKVENNAFPIEKGDEQHLTDFQRQKAKYFFNVNLDIENKEYITWEDVEFYLLFHITAAGKEGSDGGDLEARLSRAARALWEHIHDQVPLSDGKRDTLTLNQFLDTWASLIDYVVERNQLPPIIQDLVKLGFELYSTDNGDGKPTTIQPQAFDQLFQKMNLGRPFAIMAYKYLTDNGTKSLDADKIESIVKAVITSSDDENESHFLLPGFFKTISNNKNNEKDNKSSSSVQDNNQTTETTTSGKSSSTSESTSSSSQVQQSNTPTTPPPLPSQGQQKSNEELSSSSQAQQKNDPSSTPLSPTQEKKPDSSSSTQTQKSSSTSQNEVNKSSPTTPLTNQQQNASPPLSQKATIQQEDEGIRRLLQFYHIDDGDIVEVAGGSPQRLVLVHPERPLPPYIQQNKQLLQKLQQGSNNVSSIQENGSNNDQNSSSETKPKVTLEERVSRGEAQKGPTIPLRQEQKQNNSFFTDVRQVYPQLNVFQQEEQRRQAKRQATQPVVNNEKQTTEETSIANDASLSSKQNEKKQISEISREEEEKIIATVLKQLEPIVEKRVAAELHRLQSGDTDQDDDEDIIPFPFMLGGGLPFFAAQRGGAPPPSQGLREQQNASGQGQQQGNIQMGGDFGGLPPGAGLFPPQLLMAMMNDLAQGGIGGEIPGFPPNMAPPPHGPMGVEGFMMFVDDSQLMGGPPGYPPRPGPRF